ncbi:MAG TPA: hypothetical protein EYG08_05405 [Myxococcales bacterium]|nr:hypothetical protein [Myxococcales bacterium]
MLFGETENASWEGLLGHECRDRGASTTDWLRGAVSFPNVEVKGTPMGLFEGVAIPLLPADLVVIMLGVRAT